MPGGRRREELISARKVAGFTQEGLAEVLSVDRSTVARWEAGDYVPLPYLWPKLAGVLGRSRDELQALIGPVAVTPESGLDDEFEPLFAWLDRHAGWPLGKARERVHAIAPASPRNRPHLPRSVIADALAGYYAPTSDYLPYTARCGQIEVSTSVLTRPEWLDLACPLTAAGDQIAFEGGSARLPAAVNEHAAVQRLADAAASGIRIADVPLYRLLDVDPRPEVLRGKVGIASFVEYALGVDLLERELNELLTGGRAARPGSMPLRDRQLPDVAAVLDLRTRLCAGGVLALTAIARPADPLRGDADFVLLVQKRSARVVNTANRLSVIPKSFHGPLADRRADSRIGVTLRRELEEELFGRTDVDRSAGDRRVADPMHPTRLSAPMRWLVEQPGRLRTECTGFGFNLVSGNYEFASLVVIEDEEFWPRFGGDVEANWEAAGLRQYSTLDGDLVSELIGDETWSNEGLFAFLQGLRRLVEIGGDRVKIPAVELCC
ncbi:DNA-binding transcriptional regulator, XRE-family HTH domain [Amycolatopsis pretoriensis]|uniref:DNA-binding transcriptional regulator, XRE-family HTH domain n=1 Tax=Amycolatopsis pretoriensis TaxID=218821 RepID=A0A1H5QHA0_9PSEU|nr:helix-turn-helix transcriptional regulator [Amycolatopsis pretoriensis]SEF24761.1 DNA-binding transcriptional regulator, XRE-family HTH domain [Amycolatopsis pretoriensis]